MDSTLVQELIQKLAEELRIYALRNSDWNLATGSR